MQPLLIRCDMAQANQSFAIYILLIKEILLGFASSINVECVY